MPSTTPTGSPPKDLASLNGQTTNAAPPTTDTSAILANLHLLANMAKQTSTTPVTGNPGQTNGSAPSNVTFPQNTIPQNTIPQVMPAAVNPALPMPPQAVNMPVAGNGVYPYQGMTAAPQNFLQSLSGQTNVQAAPQVPAAPVMPQAQGNFAVNAETLQQQLQILSMLKQQNVPESQWATVLSVLMANSAASMAPVPNQPNYGGFAPARDESRDASGYDQYSRSPPNRYANGTRKRSRSPSPPGRNWDRQHRERSPPPRRRDSPVYGEYGNDRNGNRGENNRRGGGGGKNRDKDRSKPQDKYVRSPSPTRRHDALPTPGPKWIEYDRSIGEGMIKGKLYVKPQTTKLG